MVLSGVVLGFAPVVAFAQLGLSGSSSTCDNNLSTSGTLFTLICKIGTLLNAIVPIMIALGVVYFIWGVVTLVIADDEEAKAAGKNRVIYGIIGLAVIIGLWGLVQILSNTFGLNNDQDFVVPTLPVVIPGGNGNSGGNNSGF